MGGNDTATLPDARMMEGERWRYVNALDDELLKGGVILSEWSTFLIRDADVSYCAGANLASILTSMAGIEAHLRHECGDPPGQRRSLYHLIEAAPVETAIRQRLHDMRRFRNTWTHVKDPENDSQLLSEPEAIEGEIATKAAECVRLLREVIYLEQWI